MNFRALLAAACVCLCYLRLVKGDDDGDDGDEGFLGTEQRDIYSEQYPLPSFPSRQAPRITYGTYEAEDDAPQSGAYARPSDGFVRPLPLQGNVRPSLLGNVPMYHGAINRGDDDEVQPRNPGFIASPIPQAPVVPAGAVQLPKRGGLQLPQQSLPRTGDSYAQDSDEFAGRKFPHPQQRDDDNSDGHLQTRLSSKERHKGLGFRRQSAAGVGNDGVSSSEKGSALDTDIGSTGNIGSFRGIVDSSRESDGKEQNPGKVGIVHHGGISAYSGENDKRHSKETLTDRGNDGDDAVYRPVTIPINDNVRSSTGHSDSSETEYISREADETKDETGRKITQSVTKVGVSGESSETSQRLYIDTKKPDEEVAKANAKTTTTFRRNQGSGEDQRSSHGVVSESNKGQERTSFEDGYSDDEKGKSGDFNENGEESDSKENAELGAPQIYNDDDKAEYDDGRIDDSHDDDTHGDSKGGDVSIDHEDDMDFHPKDSAGGHPDGYSNEDNSDRTSKGKESVDANPLNHDPGTSISQEVDDSSQYLSSDDSKDKSDDSRENGEDSDSDKGSKRSDDDGESDEDDDGDDSGRESCTVNAVGRCLGRLANFHSRTLPTHLFSTVDELCSAVETMNRCFRNMKNNCPDDVLYRVNVLRQSTNYICNEKREDFGEVYNCLLEATDRYSRCYESYTSTEGSAVQRKCRPVENFEDCVAQVTVAECGQKAGDLVRNYYQRSGLNPLVDTDPDLVCPVIESFQQEDGTPDRQKTVLAVGLTLAGCVALAAGVVISAIVGAHKRTQMAHYILQDA